MYIKVLKATLRAYYVKGMFYGFCNMNDEEYNNYIVLYPKKDNSDKSYLYLKAERKVSKVGKSYIELV